MNATMSLNPALMSVLLDQLPSGAVRPANLIANVQAKVPLTHKGKVASFRKITPGNYEVALDDAKITATTAVEAKLMILDYLGGVKQSRK